MPTMVQPGTIGAPHYNGYIVASMPTTDAHDAQASLKNGQSLSPVVGIPQNVGPTSQYSNDNVGNYQMVQQYQNPSQVQVQGQGQIPNLVQQNGINSPPVSIGSHGDNLPGQKMQWSNSQKENSDKN